jgi:hypothetical protein
MSNWPYSIVMIIPAVLQESANKLAEGLGHGPNNFSVALSSDGSEPVTHYSCRAQAQQSFIDLLTAVGEGTLPEVPDMTPEEVGGVLIQLQVDISVSEDGYTHFERVINEKNLVRMNSEFAN